MGCLFNYCRRKFTSNKFTKFILSNCPAFAGVVACSKGALPRAGRLAGTRSTSNHTGRIAYRER
jgi:hypothetical protein